MTRPCLPLSTTALSGSVRHEYIARYAYRVAITNSRILDVTDSNVLYDYKDYRKGGKHGVMTLYFVSFVTYFEIVASLFVYILRGKSPFFSFVSCHLTFGNHAKTDIFPHNNQITFAAAVQRSGASYHLAGDTKPILFPYCHIESHHGLCHFESHQSGIIPL